MLNNLPNDWEKLLHVFNFLSYLAASVLNLILENDKTLKEIFELFILKVSRFDYFKNLS